MNVKSTTPALKKSELLGYWFFFFCIIGLLYFPSRHAGLVSDYTGWVERFIGSDLSDAWHCFGYPGLQQIAITFFFACYKWFGDWALGWTLVYWAFHASNTLLLFLFLRRIFGLFELDFSHWRSLVLAVLWMLICWHAEVLIWKVCQNYFLIVFFNLLAYHCYLSYFLGTQLRYLLLGHFLFFVALFTFEQSLVNIAFIALLHALLFVSGLISWSKDILVKVYLPMLAGLVIYFAINTFWLGELVGHYGADVHLSLNVRDVLSNYLLYFTKQLTWWRFAGYSWKLAFTEYMQNNALILTFLSALVFFLWFFWHRKTLHGRLALFFLLASIILLLPVSNLFFYWIGLGENDRYHYVFSMFFYPIIAMIIYRWNTTIQMALAVILFSIHIITTQHIVRLWSGNQHVLDHIVEEYRWQDEDLVFFFNTPDNFGGTFMLPSFEGRGFYDYYFFTKGNTVACEPIDILQYPMTTINDGVSVKRIDSNTVKLSFNQWGNWWMLNGVGAPKQIETQYYSVKLGNWNDYYLTKKPAADSAVWIYQDGTRLKEYKW